MGRDVTNLTSSDEKSIALAGILLPVVILAIPLGLWRVIYRFTDWAALFLVPLALVLLIGFHRQLASVLRAKAVAVVQPDSPIAMFATGRVRAGAHSIVFVASAVFVLAWHALEANAADALALRGVHFVHAAQRLQLLAALLHALVVQVVGAHEQLPAPGHLHTLRRTTVRLHLRHLFESC